MVENSLTKENGHYVMNLPFKNENCKMPSKRNVAFHRLSLLKKRFESDKNLYKDYQKFMKTVITKGYAQEKKHVVSKQTLMWVWSGTFHITR